MLKPLRRLIPGLALPILALSALAGCTQPDVKDETKTQGTEDMKSLSSKLDQPYLINEQGEVIAEIPPFILEKMKEDLRQQARMAEVSELERMYDAESGKLRDGEDFHPHRLRGAGFGLFRPCPGEPVGAGDHQDVAHPAGHLAGIQDFQLCRGLRLLHG